MNVEHRLATIGTYLNPLEAHVSRALLVSEGIPAVLSNELFAMLNSGQLEDALNRQWEIPTPICSKCGSTQLTEVRSSGSISSSLLALFFGVPVFSLPKKRVCTKCGGMSSVEIEKLA